MIETLSRSRPPGLPPNGFAVSTLVIDRMRTLALIAALVVATMSMGAPIATMAATPAAVSLPITIEAPASGMAGTICCFQLVALGGLGSLLVEVNEVKVPVVLSSGGPGDGKYCFLLPPGASGGVAVVTAVSATGAVATAVIAIT
jgi:hypothetical protein